MQSFRLIILVLLLCNNFWLVLGLCVKQWFSCDIPHGNGDFEQQLPCENAKMYDWYWQCTPVSIECRDKTSLKDWTELTGYVLQRATGGMLYRKLANGTVTVVGPSPTVYCACVNSEQDEQPSCDGIDLEGRLTLQECPCQMPTPAPSQPPTEPPTTPPTTPSPTPSPTPFPTTPSPTPFPTTPSPTISSPTMPTTAPPTTPFPTTSLDPTTPSPTTPSPTTSSPTALIIPVTSTTGLGSSSSSEATFAPTAKPTPLPTPAQNGITPAFQVPGDQQASQLLPQLVAGLLAAFVAFCFVLLVLVVMWKRRRRLPRSAPTAVALRSRRSHATTVPSRSRTNTQSSANKSSSRRPSKGRHSRPASRTIESTEYAQLPVIDQSSQGSFGTYMAHQPQQQQQDVVYQVPSPIVNVYQPMPSAASADNSPAPTAYAAMPGPNPADNSPAPTAYTAMPGPNPTRNYM